MVVAQSFQDIFEASAKTINLNLPQHKESSLKLEFGTCKDNKLQFNGSEPPLPFAASQLYHSSIESWRRLTAKSKECKAVYEVSLDIMGNNITYKPGDTIGIIPRNNKSEVDFLITHLALTSLADISYSLNVENTQKSTKTRVPAHIPISSTIRYVFTHCVDLRTVVKKLFLLALSRYTKDDIEKKVLEYLCSKEGANAYTTHILNANTCLLDLLAKFKSCKPPIEILFQHLPRLLPRPYSIVNSPMKDPHIVKICFSVMDIGNNRKGLTTGWLEDIILNRNLSLEDAFNNLSVAENQTVPIYLRKNMNCFELPLNIDSSMILIGPGTGVAPYIGFLEQIEYMKSECQSDSCNIWLFFGCRHPNLDFIYQQELNDFVEKKVLSCLETAFSRYEDNGPKYVQDALMKNGEEVVKLIKNGSRIFVCGDHKNMAVQVQQTIVNCLVKHDGRTEDEAEKIVHDLQKDKMYVVDIWN